jgi:omega-amidase
MMRSTNLGVSALQYAIHWENKSKNFQTITHFLDILPEKTDLVILPEMFTTGFSMQPEKLAENMTGISVGWMKGQARSRNIYICGSIIIRENKQYFNRLICATPDGKIWHYDKRHLFTMAGEEKKYTPGTDRPVWKINGWRILPQVCYDLRFPVWSRNDLNYDIAIYPANWPQRRDYPWKMLLRARAIENQAYIIGVNRVGNDGNDVAHNGCSAIIDPLGEILTAPEENTEGWFHTQLESEKLEKIRKSFPFLPDKDAFSIKY